MITNAFDGTKNTEKKEHQQNTDATAVPCLPCLSWKWTWKQRGSQIDKWWDTRNGRSILLSIWHPQNIQKRIKTGL